MVAFVNTAIFVTTFSQIVSAEIKHEFWLRKLYSYESWAEWMYYSWAEMSAMQSFFMNLKTRNRWRTKIEAYEAFASDGTLKGQQNWVGKYSIRFGYEPFLGLHFGNGATLLARRAVFSWRAAFLCFASYRHMYLCPPPLAPLFWNRTYIYVISYYFEFVEDRFVFAIFCLSVFIEDSVGVFGILPWEKI